MDPTPILRRAAQEADERERRERERREARQIDDEPKTSRPGRRTATTGRANRQKSDP
jgi:hypothetical protein